MRTDNPWKILDSKIKYQNPWIRVREDKVITPTGNEGIYGVMESNDSVMIAALNDRHELYLVRTFAYPAQSWNWELPGGGGDKQDLIEASKRELEEETGIVADTWELLGKVRANGGLMTEQVVFYLARDLSFSGEKEVSDEQIDETGFFSIEQIDAMVKSEEINSAACITGIHLAQKWIALNA